jgi:hypothetical protein
MCTLEETLNNFVHDKKHQDGISENDLNEWFKKIAQIILSGHFEIKNNNNDKECVKVHPTTVEMYFHEERKDTKYIKDHIVYHKNEKNANTERLNKNNDIEYYKPGVLNTHPSGIDITFESEDYRFRASALIRAFKVENDQTSKVTGVQYKNSKKVKENIDDRSTYVYDALFSQFDIFGEGFSVKWVDGDKLKAINDPKQRRNVYEYDGDTKASTPDTRQWSFSAKENQDQ